MTKVLVSCLLIAVTLTASARRSLPVRELSTLDKDIERAQVYRQTRLSELDSIRMRLGVLSPEANRGRCLFNLQLAEGFLTMNADSSLFYASQAIHSAEQTADPLLQLRAAIARVNALSTAGIFSEALPEYRRLLQLGAPDSLKLALWMAGRQLYAYMSVYMADNPTYSARYQAASQACDDSLIRNLPPTHLFSRFLKAERAVRQEHTREAKRLLGFLLDEIEPSSRLYGMCAYQMACACRDEGDLENQVKWLAVAADCDVRLSIAEGLALPTLANLLYANGEFDRAFKYINFALQDASTGNARMRTVSIANSVPMIDGAYRNSMNNTAHLLQTLLIICCLLLVVSVFLLIYRYKARKRMQAANELLKRQARQQESYIGNFLQLCGAYAGKLNQVNKLVGRKLIAGQADDLLKLVNSGRLVDEKNEDFYAVFDRSFLDLYPDFVFEINKLLRPDAQIDIKHSGTLTPELRIYALVRLGVSQTPHIAEILRFSNHTVYTYRNRMRNRSINRESFDSDVIKMGERVENL